MKGYIDGISHWKFMKFARIAKIESNVSIKYILILPVGGIKFSCFWFPAEESPTDFQMESFFWGQKTRLSQVL